MTDLTGGIAVETKLKLDEAATKEAFQWLYENQHQILLTSSVWGRGGKQPNGLCEGHVYSMLQIVTLKDNSGQTVQLLRIRNPWGNGFEWSGDWSDSSAKWGSISYGKRKELQVQRDDGAFWICYQDWVNNFTTFGACILPDKFNYENGPSFNHEHRVSGYFQKSTYEVKFKLQVHADTCVLLQILLDDLREEDKEQQVRVKLLVSNDAGRSDVRPTLPTNENDDTEKQGYVYNNLAKGNYTVTLRLYSKSSNVSLRTLDGRKWMIRAVSKDVFLQKIN